MKSTSRISTSRRLSWAVLAISMALLACSFGTPEAPPPQPPTNPPLPTNPPPSEPPPTDPPPPTDAPQPTAPPAPTLQSEPTNPPVPTSTTSAQPTIVYFDDFSDTNGGWTQFDVPKGFMGYFEGAFNITVEETELLRWSHNFKQFTDATIQVQVVSLAGPADAEAGVICRFQDDDNFYAFTYTADGYYAIYRNLDGEFEILSNDDDYEESAAIQQGDTANEIMVSCIGDTLRFYINGVLLIEVVDTTFASGEVGLIAGTFDTPGTDVLFDDFTVYEE